MALDFITKLPGKAIDWLSGGDMPEAQNAQLSPGAQDIIGSQYLQAQKTPEQILSERTQGMDESKSLLHPVEQSYLGGQSNDVVSQALRARTARSLGDNLSRMKNKMSHDVSDIESKNLDSAGRSLQQKRNLEVENYRRQMDRYNAQVSARNAAISSIFQAGGMIAGAVIGGPGGAAVGSQVGGAVAPKQTNYSSKNIGGEYSMSGRD